MTPFHRMFVVVADRDLSGSSQLASGSISVCVRILFEASSKQFKFVYALEKHFLTLMKNTLLQVYIKKEGNREEKKMHK